MKLLLPTPENIVLAAEALRAGDLVGMPTETVYGLAGDAMSSAAVEKIYAVKSRPAHNPLIIHVANAETAMHYGQFNSAARAFAAVFWPGPLTLVVARNESTKLAAHFSSLTSLALRVPAHPAAQNLLRAFGGPIAAPSANRSGELSPTQANHVAEAFKDYDQPKIILAGGRADAGLESTIVDCTGAAPKILRPGSIIIEELRAVVPETIDFSLPTAEPAAPIAPGQLLKHYAPRTRLRLNARDIAPDEALLAFGPEPPWAKRALMVLNLSPAGDLTEAAHHLFSHLHTLDGQGARAIAVMPIPPDGVGAAIQDRLGRAAA